MTHDLLGQVMIVLQATLRRVLITERREDVYVAEVELSDRDGSVVRVSARPSDAIALALRLNAPILVSETLLADAAWLGRLADGLLQLGDNVHAPGHARPSGRAGSYSAAMSYSNIT
jgi:bifunctional DNase/RNase